MPAVKPGASTSEFWASLVTLVAGVALAFGASDHTAQVVGACVVLAAGGLYSIGRVVIKRAALRHGLPAPAVPELPGGLLGVLGPLLGGFAPTPASADRLLTHGLAPADPGAPIAGAV